jgi:hypothetical protein
MPSYRGRRLDGSVHELHQAVDLLQADTVPLSYAQKVWASQYEREQASHPTDRTTTNPKREKEQA